MSKITIATVKSFIRKNRESLLIKTGSRFDGMTDCVQQCENQNFRPAMSTDHAIERTYGINGVWFVGSSRDYITPFERDGLRGFNIYNCCGSFDLAVKI